MDKKLHARPRVSVVMCSYNALSFIEKAVQSILKQTYTHWELVISDDGSTDGTREWLRSLRDPRIRIFYQENNLGYVANKNFAISQATGMYITQQDNDDTCTLDRLQAQMDVVLQYPEIKIVACGYQMIDAQGTVFKTTVADTEGLVLKKGTAPYPFWFPSLLVHQEVYKNIGLFDTYFAGAFGDDIYWAVKANERYPVYCLNKPLYHYRTNPHSITNVLDNKRKLIMSAVLEELFKQRSITGTDWLEENNHQALIAFEQKLLHDRKFMGKQYQVWAAKAVDKHQWQQAAKLLVTSFKLYQGNLNLYKTLIYYCRKKIAINEP